MAAASLDAGYIATSYAVPESTLQSLLDAPTTELVKALLEKIEEKAREHEQLQAEKLRADVELEAAVRNGSSRTKQLKETVDKGLKEVEGLRKKLAAEETSRASLESELQTLKTSSSSSTSEVQALQSRITSLESTNRDTVTLLESKSTACDRVAEEVSAQQQKSVALRREVSELEAKVQTAENAALQFKFREQHLQEEVELLKKRDEWHDEELKRRSAEHTKYRKEKTAQVAESQRTIEELSQTSETLRSSENQLRLRLDDVTRKLEDAYTQLQSKDEEAARKENGLRSEKDTAVRLGNLQKQSAETARARLEEVERNMAQLREDAATEIGNLQADVTAERKDKETAEQRVAELEDRVDALQTEVSAQQIPSTPRRGLNGVNAHGTPARLGSPLTPGASRLKAGMTMTQMVAEFSKQKVELDSQRRVANELRQELDNMISDLENRQPEIQEMRMDYERLQTEIQDASALLEQSNQDRDAARKIARKWEGTAKGLTKETALLGQQLRDFSTQIKLLLVEIQSREQGLDSLTPEQQAQFEQLARGEIDESALEGMSDTGRFISQRLVVFRGVSELQEQNQRLLHMTRKLGEEMEGEEAKAQKYQQEQNQAELEDLRHKVAEYKDNIQSLTTRSESYIRERDMFRRMLAHRGQLPPGIDVSAVFNQSIDSTFMPATPSRSQSVEPSADARALSDHIKLLKELQQHFDAYRNESATDQAALKRQNDQLSQDKSKLQGENARLSSKDAVSQERYGLLQSNYDMLKTENGEMQKRSQILAENAAKQDLRTQQVAEDLIEAKSLAESMRNETANLKAERELWKRIETRLTEDNRSLIDERSRLNKMVGDLQSLQNERELADAETRRRLQSRVETLESELAVAKRKLDEEVEQGKKAALRREYETDQNRTRIDDLLKSSANYKEELIAVKTQRDQLQARVDEIKIELRNVEERSIALQPRLSTRPTSGTRNTETDENALTREQELGVEVADLKRDLELRSAELQSAKEEIEQYKAIAQSAEEELQQMNETSDVYREEMDKAVEEKDAKIQELEKRVEEISSELASTNTDLSSLRSKEDEGTTKFNEQRSIYESELSRLRDESDRLAETARLHQEDLKVQAEIAQQAQQNYENELVRHAEAAGALQKLRTEHSTIKLEVAGHKAEAEAAKLSLAQNEESWTEIRSKYETEISEIKNSREDLKVQNRRLHTQLEELSTQIASLKHSRAAIANEDVEGGVGAATDSTSNNLQEIVRYLRQEKEIVDMQYELQIQESKRLQQQLEHANSQLEEVREKLENERRSQVDREAAATSHTKLMQTINELNLFRESNSSLRSEAHSAQQQLARKVKECEELVAQLEPLRSKTSQGEYELEAKIGEIKLLQEDRDRWQKRTQDIMQKYDRVDPAELEGLRNKITTLTSEKEAAVAEKAPLQAQVDAFPERIKQETEELTKTFDERRAKLIEQSKSKNRENIEKLRDANGKLEAAVAERARISDELASAQEALEKTRSELEVAIQERDLAVTSAEEAKQQAQNAVPVDAINTTNPMAGHEKGALEAQVAAAEERANSEASRAAISQQEVEAHVVKIEGLQSQVTNLEQSLQAVQTQLANVKPRSEAAPAPPSEELDRLQADLATAQREIELLKTSSGATATAVEGLAPASVEEIENRISELRMKLETEYAEQGKKQDELFHARTQQMKTALNKKVAEIKQKNEEAIAKLKSEHDEALKQSRAEAPPSALDPPAVASSGLNDESTNTNGVKSAPYQPSDEEAKELVRTNKIIQSVLRGNIDKEVLRRTQQVKTDEEKAWSQKLEEARKQADAEKDKAVGSAKEMTIKQSNMKVNIMTKQRDALAAQVDVVKTAASETPQRPVGEVWEIAKTTKPGAALTTQRASLAPGSLQTGTAAAVTTAAAAPPPSSTNANVQVPIAQTTQTASAQATQPQSAQPVQAVPNQATQPPPQNGTLGQATADSQTPFTTITASALPQSAVRRTSIAPGGPNAFGAPSALPQAATNQHGAGRGQTSNAGTGPAALKTLASTGIPRPGQNQAASSAPGGRGRGDNAQRGGALSSLPRGGGSQLPRGGGQLRGPRGGARGGGGRGRGGAPGSPMNPSAGEFTPGIKRPHDGAGAEGGDGKKPRSDAQ